MGCCSSHEMDAEANWTADLPCQCSRQYSFTTSLEHVVVPQEPITFCCCCCEEKGTGGQAVQNRAREAVQATIKCDLCGHQFGRTYELLYQEKRKQWGYYSKRTGVLDHSADRFSFAHLEQCYAQIQQHTLYPHGHKVRMRPNEHWAEEFYQLVTAGELNRAYNSPSKIRYCCKKGCRTICRNGCGSGCICQLNSGAPVQMSGSILFHHHFGMGDGAIHIHRCALLHQTGIITRRCSGDIQMRFVRL